MPANQPSDEHLNLLREMRNALRTLPDDLVRLLGRGPGGGLFPEGTPASPRGDKTPGQADEHKGPADQLHAAENAGFALSRFVPIFGQLAGFSRDVRAVMEAFSALGKMRAEGTTVAASGGLGKAGAARKDTAERQQELFKGFNARPPDWLTRAKLEGKDTSGRLGSPLGPAALKLPGIAGTGRPPPTDEEVRRALGIPRAPGPGPASPPPPRGIPTAAGFDPHSPLYPKPAPAAGTVPTAASFERASLTPPPGFPPPGGTRAAAPPPPALPPSPRAVPLSAVPPELARTLGLSRTKQTQLTPSGTAAPAGARAPTVPTSSASEGFPPRAQGGVPTENPAPSGGVGQQVVARLDQLIALATGERQQQQDEASDTPDDNTRHTEDLKGKSFWQQEKGGAGEVKGGLHAEALASPKSGGKGGSGMIESIASEVLKAAITAALVG